MSLDNKVAQLRPNQNISRPIGHYSTDDAYSRHGGGNGGGNMLEARVAKLESDVEYIKRDLAEVKSDIKSVDSRLSGIETSISSAKPPLRHLRSLSVSCSHFAPTFLEVMFPKSLMP